MSLKEEKKFNYVVKYRPRNIYFENREGTYIGRMSISSKRLISAICIIIAFGMSLVVIQLTYVIFSE